MMAVIQRFEIFEIAGEIRRVKLLPSSRITPSSQRIRVVSIGVSLEWKRVMIATFRQDKAFAHA